MTEPLIIDGWVCSESRLARAVQAQDGTAFVYDFSLGLTGTSLQCSVAPPAVLAWLVAPLIERGK